MTSKFWVNKKTGQVTKGSRAFFDGAVEVDEETYAKAAAANEKAADDHIEQAHADLAKRLEKEKAARGKLREAAVVSLVEGKPLTKEQAELVAGS